MFKSVLFALAALPANTVYAAGFTLASPDIQPGSRIARQEVFDGYGCNGGNVSPALTWHGAPPGTKSLAVTAYDPDASTGHGWWHWVVFNLPANTTGLKKGAGNPKAHLMPAGAVQGRNDFGQIGYGGPCPPVGDQPHRYRFTVYALKVAKLPLDENSPAARVDHYLRGHMLDKAVLQGTYGR